MRVAVRELEPDALGDEVGLDGEPVRARAGERENELRADRGRRRPTRRERSGRRARGVAPSLPPPGRASSRAAARPASRAGPGPGRGSRASPPRGSSCGSRRSPPGRAACRAAVPGAKQVRALGEARQRLVGRGDQRIGPGLEGVRRQRRVEAEVGAPRLVDEQRDPRRSARGGDRRHVAQRADVVRLDEEDRRRRPVRRRSRPRPARAGSRARARSPGRRRAAPRPARGPRARARRGATCAGSSRRSASCPARRRASVSAWLPWVEPFRQKRQRSAPQSSAARRSACPSTSARGGGRRRRRRGAGRGGATRSRARASACARASRTG